MKTLFWIAASALVGVAGGIISTTAEFWSTRETFRETELGAAPLASADGAAPKLEVEGGTSFDFGSMERNQTKTHAFIVRNLGTAPLTLKKGDTSCKCTLSGLTKDEVEPGGSAEVNLEWKAKDFSLEFRQRAEIITNDPVTPLLTLTVHGRVLQAVRPNPEEITLAALSASVGAKAEILVFGYREEPLKIVATEWGNRETAEAFEVVLSPIPEERVAREPGARSGTALAITVKGGLPLGPIQQTLRLYTNLVSEPVDIPIRGTVVSDISFVPLGVEFIPEKSLLALGSVDSRQGAKVRMQMLIKGPHWNTTQVSLGEIDPADGLKATLGEPKPIEGRNVMMIPLTIEIPQGAPPMNRLGSDQGKVGKVMIETTHPAVKQAPIYVQFLVE